MIIAAALFAASLAYPDADTVLVNEIEKVRYNPDGTYETTDESWTKILTEKGRREESTASLDYSRRYGEAQITYVGAIGTNGVERQIDVSATMKESTDNSSMSANIYDPLDRTITCTIPGLRIGETVHIKTRRKTVKPRCENQWADISVMEWKMPIERSEFEVTAPKELPLKNIAICHPLGNVVTNVTQLADGSTVYSFVSTNSAQVFPEPDMPPLHTQVQNVRVSTAATWQEISRWYWKLCEGHLAKTNAAMVAKALELKDVRSIFKFVSQEIRYMGLTMEDTSPGYAPHDVDVTFDNRYGVCRDKAGLLVAMLRLAGHKAFPVLIHVGAKHDPAVPQPYFNHAIVAVEGKGGYELMDPTNENTKDLFPAYLCDKSYLVCRPEGEDLKVSEVPDPEGQRLVVVSNGTLTKDGSVFLQSEITMNGINDTAYRHALVKMTDEDRVKFFERVVKALVSGAELVNCDIEPKDMRDTARPIVIRLSARFPEMLLTGETIDELNVPLYTRSMGVVNFLLSGNTALVKRRYPLHLDTTAKTEERLSVSLGSSVGEVRSLPPAERIEGRYSFSSEYSVTNRTLQVHRVQTLGAVEFSSAEYADLRERLKDVEAAERRRASFAKNRLADADMRYLLDSTETTIKSDREWVTTNTIVKQVLTYRGKKEASELKIAYNPTWRNEEVVSAVVSNRDGRVARVTEKEINVMDVGWVSSAPRYPASKILVVNFPSVEIGSTLAYTIVTTVTNAPVGFYDCYAFDSKDPVDHKIVRVNDYHREEWNLKSIPREPGQPNAFEWRDVVAIASNRFEAMDLRVKAVEMPKLKGLKEIRDWMAKYVKIAGPMLYGVPPDQQMTDPQVVLKERYASRLDYIRTMCSLMKGAGYEAKVVFAADDDNGSEAYRNRIRFKYPSVWEFSFPLCRVVVREGGFLGFGAKERVVYIGTENQYAEIGATAFEGCDYFDPETAEFGVVTVPERRLSGCTIEKRTYTIREDGAADVDVENLIYGSEVGTFRKTYSELLPEERFRRFQSILGGISQAAMATRELETDIEGYPARRTFSCYVPEYATVNDDTISLQLPMFISNIPSFTGKLRETPFEVAACGDEEETVTIRFPKGYTKAEHLPKPFVFTDPADDSCVWLEYFVRSEVKDDALEVELRRVKHRHLDSMYGPKYFELIRDWQRIASSRANRTIFVRRR